MICNYRPQLHLITDVDAGPLTRSLCNTGSLCYLMQVLIPWTTIVEIEWPTTKPDCRLDHFQVLSFYYLISHPQPLFLSVYKRCVVHSVFQLSQANEIKKYRKISLQSVRNRLSVKIADFCAYTVRDRQSCDETGSCTVASPVYRPSHDFMAIFQRKAFSFASRSSFTSFV